MTVTETGWQPETLLAHLDRLPALLDEAAEAHAAAIVEEAETLGYLHHPRREITREGEGVRVITDYGLQMTYLQSKVIPMQIGGQTVFRRASAASMAAGHWWYPGRLDLLQQADQSLRVRDVVRGLVQRIIRELQRS